MKKIDLRRIDLNLLVVFDVLMQERSVTRAAERLGRTQSAVSHALARLREQLDDPLLVKSGARMDASPFAEHLVLEVRPILSNIERVLVPPQAFDPATTAREFRIAIPDINASLFPLLAARMRRAAPACLLEWLARDGNAALAVAEGRIDVALLPSAVPLPDGVDFTEAGAFKWASFVRKAHPAASAWGRAAWSKWPHVGVRVGMRVDSPVDTAASLADDRRQITTWVPHFSAVAPLLAHTDLIATLPMLVMVDTIKPYGLRVLKAPIRIEPMPHRLIWSRRLGNDAAVRWLRSQVEAVLNEVTAAADAAMP
jgi:DNA-binding transcriptional LysR family regulator